MNIKDGKLVYKVTNNYKSITQKYTYLSHFKVFSKTMMNSRPQFFKKILSNRERVERVQLKHVKNRGLNLT